MSAEMSSACFWASGDACRSAEKSSSIRINLAKVLVSSNMSGVSKECIQKRDSMAEQASCILSRQENAN